MQWVGSRRPATLVPPRVPERGAERRDLNGRAGGIGKERPTVSRLAPGTIAESRLERVDIAPNAESVVAWTSLPACQATDRGPNSKIKRLFDLVLALIGLFVLLPMLVVVALAVTIDSPGPVFFKQWRGG